MINSKPRRGGASDKFENIRKYKYVDELNTKLFENMNSQQEHFSFSANGAKRRDIVRSASSSERSVGSLII